MDAMREAFTNRLVDVIWTITSWIIGRLTGETKNLYWHFRTGAVIVLPWPSGYTEPDHLGNSTNSADPNAHYRPWLETYVGKQGRDWEWKQHSDWSFDIAGTVTTNDSVELRFRKGKEQYASLAALKWCA
jgi:hypothetical protein